MTSHNVNRESGHASIFMSVLLAAAGFLMTIYSLWIMGTLIVQWFVRPY